MTSDDPNSLNLHESKAVDWGAIEDRFLDLIHCGWSLEPMLQLVRHIKATDLSKKLFAYTSHEKLIIGTSSMISHCHDSLHVWFEGSSRTWHFKYHPKINEPAEFIKTYSEKFGIEKFNQIISYLNW